MITDTKKSFIYEGSRMRGVGKNLSLLLRHARSRHGVRMIRIEKLPQDKASMTVVYSDGATGHIVFAEAKHCLEWALEKSRRPGTWWSGCRVEHDGEVLVPGKSYSQPGALDDRMIIITR